MRRHALVTPTRRSLQHDADAAGVGACPSAAAAILALVELRVLSPDDWELWREVRLQALAEAPEAFGSTIADWLYADQSRWRQRLFDVPINFVAVVNDVAVGQASGTVVDHEGCVDLISMWVAPTGRGSGVADALVTAVKNYAHEAGANAVKLSVRRLNTRAIHLYERTGFVPVDGPGDDHDEIAMCGQL